MREREPELAYWISEYLLLMWGLRAPPRGFALWLRGLRIGERSNIGFFSGWGRRLRWFVSVADSPSIGIDDAVRRCGPYMVLPFNRRRGRALVGPVGLAGGVSVAFALVTICLWLGMGSVFIVRTR